MANWCNTIFAKHQGGIMPFRQNSITPFRKNYKIARWHNANFEKMAS
jgi:hypothetical protein